MNRKQLLLSSAILCALGGAAWGPAVAQEATVPSKPITLVIPFPPGGATDVLGRLIGKKLGDKLGQSVVIDNRAGAGTTIGAAYVAKAAPDGYTLLMSSGTTFTVNPAVRAKLPYDPVKSFEPIGIAGRTSLILLANKDVPVSDVKQFVAMVKAAPDKYSYGSYGAGTTSQFAGEMFFHAAGLKIQHVPYKGSSPAMVDLMGGQIDLYMSSVPTLLGHVRNGKLKVIAITSAQRSAQLPDVPTLAESGFKGFEAVTWFGVLAPAGTPAAIVAQLNKAINQALKQPDVADKLRSEGGDILGGTSEQFAALLRTEVPRWSKIVKDSGASLD